MAADDGKQRLSDVANAETLLRLVQSVPSPKAEPIKLWLAKVGYERMQERSDRRLVRSHHRSCTRSPSEAETADGSTPCPQSHSPPCRSGVGGFYDAAGVPISAGKLGSPMGGDSTNGLNVDLDLHLTIGRAFVVTRQRRHIGVVPAHGNFDIGLIRLAIVRWVQRPPPNPRN